MKAPPGYRAGLLFYRKLLKRFHPDRATQGRGDLLAEQGATRRRRDDAAWEAMKETNVPYPIQIGAHGARETGRMEKILQERRREICKARFRVNSY
ncbi:hypothetical protein ASE07_02330 [Noviherbaspirillum sp. Root189]|nr:hypothetical protein ASE07_02330 [Noviherbaspirillum sp. Root189]